jgi:hypothetical protein
MDQVELNHTVLLHINVLHSLDSGKRKAPQFLWGFQSLWRAIVDEFHNRALFEIIRDHGLEVVTKAKGRD